MRHLDEGTILEVRDRDSVVETALEHLDDCGICTGVLEESKARSDLILDVLSSLDDVVDTELAKSLVRRRLDMVRSSSARPGTVTDEFSPVQRAYLPAPHVFLQP